VFDRLDVRLLRPVSPRGDWVLHVGDFGVWPDPERIDRATRYHDGAGEFSEWLRAMMRIPRQTIFIKGNHEDFARLELQTGQRMPWGGGEQKFAARGMKVRKSKWVRGPDAMHG
jgi:hypothetical protein